MESGRPRTLRCHGLSLVEVLVAVGLCAGAVVAVLALFGPALRGVREAEDRGTALRLVDEVDAELRRAGFMRSAAATADGAVLELVARGDGSQVVLAADADNDPVAGAPRGIPAGARYFRIVVSRALRPASDAAVVVVAVEVSWPLAAPDLQRTRTVCHLAINR